MFIGMGEIVRAVGLKGEVKFLPDGDFHEPVLDGPYLRVRGPDGEPRTATVLHRRSQGDAWILRLEGVEDRDAAEALVGRELGFTEEDYDREGFPRPAEPHPFLYHGLTVVTVSGQEVGRVGGVMVLPANLVLQVETGRREILIPVIPPVIRELDREGQRLVIEPLPGLLDEES